MRSDRRTESDKDKRRRYDSNESRDTVQQSILNKSSEENSQVERGYKKKKCANRRKRFGGEN